MNCRRSLETALSRKPVVRTASCSLFVKQPVFHFQFTGFLPVSCILYSQQSAVPYCPLPDYYCLCSLPSTVCCLCKNSISSTEIIHDAPTPPFFEIIRNCQCLCPSSTNKFFQANAVEIFFIYLLSEHRNDPRT